MQIEYLVQQHMDFAFTYFSMTNLICFIFTGFLMFGVKFVPENSRKFFNFKSVRRDLVLL